MFSPFLWQVEFESEKNRILSVMFERMQDDSSTWTQQMTQMAFIEEHNIACLDSRAIAFFLLQVAVVGHSYGHSCVQTLLPTIAAALRHQTTALFKQVLQEGSLTTSVDFVCYLTQCSASTLLALNVYGGSDAAATTIVSSLTDPVLELLRGYVRNEDTRSSCTWRKLTDYLDDMTTIVAAFCRQIGGPAMIYRRTSALAERLVLMKCSAAQLLPNCDHAFVPVCLTERLNEFQ